MKNNLPVSWVMALSLVGMKCVVLLNQYTTTMIASNPFDGGKLTMKSMDTLSHNYLRINNGHNNLTCFFFWCSVLLANQTSLHVFLCIVFQIRLIINLLEECYSVLYTIMAHKGPIMTLLQKHIPKSHFQNIKPILLVPQQSILQVEV